MDLIDITPYIQNNHEQNLLLEGSDSCKLRCNSAPLVGGYHQAELDNPDLERLATVRIVMLSRSCLESSIMLVWVPLMPAESLKFYVSISTATAIRTPEHQGGFRILLSASEVLIGFHITLQLVQKKWIQQDWSSTNYTFCTKEDAKLLNSKIAIVAACSQVWGYHWHYEVLWNTLHTAYPCQA